MNRNRSSDERPASFNLTKTKAELETMPAGTFALQSPRMRQFNILLAELEAAINEQWEFGSTELRTNEARSNLRRFVRTTK